jgi:hypothetical protein
MSSAQRQLSEFIARYDPKIAARAKAALAKVRKILPGAMELVYDNYNALAIAFGPTDRVSDVILSIALYPRWISLFFVRGIDLEDPQKLLVGSGKTIRHIVLDDAADLDKPAIRALITQAVKLSAKPLNAAPGKRLIIKSISARQRPRRAGGERKRPAG